ncbi:MAG: 50S ribosomal protein L20 [Patescibacteria group bacterium]|nr:50S ribosomal protein L20 [Patescibacteria group bacterium]
MSRVKRGIITQKKHKKLRKLVKGFRTLRRHSIKLARQAHMKALSYAYRDRRNKKRDFRRLWIVRINAAVQNLGSKYNHFIHGLKKNNIEIDKKILAQIAHKNPEIFESIHKQVQ